MGYGPVQLADLEATIAAAVDSGCEVVVNGSPFSLARLLRATVPIRDATYSLREVGPDRLADVLSPWVARWQPAA
jgi:predicted GTPase